MIRGVENLGNICYEGPSGRSCRFASWAYMSVEELKMKKEAPISFKNVSGDVDNLFVPQP